MRVFISWSGDRAKYVAGELEKWLRQVVQHVEPWFSPEEIRSGEQWLAKIASVLDETDYGIVCLTMESQHAPWLLFESGALAKHVGAKVTPLYIDLQPTDIDGPLASFQGVQLNSDGVRQLVIDLNRAAGSQVDNSLLEGLFSHMWPVLEAALAKLGDIDAGTRGSSRPVDEMLREVLEIVRRVEGQRSDHSSQPVASPGSPERQALYRRIDRLADYDSELVTRILEAITSSPIGRDEIEMVGM
jgi:hypothetical protein